MKLIRSEIFGQRDDGRGSDPRRLFALEPLECRLLLSAAIQITGRGQDIANGDLDPNTGNFTDFRNASISVNKAIGTDTRTFEITDTGDAPLDLSKSAISISGPNHSDFILAVKAATVIEPGSSSSFTIAFEPHAAELAFATVTIHSNDPNNPVFSFAIQGTGVKPKNLGKNLLSATTQAGSGTAAVVGSEVTINYTGWLPDGLVFDSSVADPQAPGHAPLQITVGAHSVVAGWEDGLVGIEPGETRILFIPAALAYGAAGNSSQLVAIPPNTPLIISVTAVSVSASPSLEVTGNDDGSDVVILNGSSTPTLSNGALLRAAATGPPSHAPPRIPALAP